MTNNTPDYNDNLYFKKLQKSKNVANNVTNKNLQDLTEQWKKGEFIVCNAGRCQYYYVQNEKQQEVIKTEYCLFDDNTPHWKILAPVPSYEEWKELIESEEKSHLQADSYYNKILEIKALLKECKDVMNMAGYVFAKVEDVEKAKDLIKKIDEVLK